MNGGGRGDYKIHMGRLSKTEQIVQNRADLSMLEVEDVDPDRQVPKKKPLSFDFPVLAAADAVNYFIFVAMVKVQRESTEI